MKKNKKIILSIISIILIAVTTYGIKVLNSKTDVGEEFTHMNNEMNELLEHSYIDCYDSSYILKIKGWFVACNTSESDYCWSQGDTINDVKKTPGLIENKNGKLKVTIYDYDNAKVIHSITINSGEEISEFFFLEKGSQYRITYTNVNSAGYLFMKSLSYEL